MIRPCTTADAAAIAAIYNHYVRETVITFEETPVATDEMAARIAKLVPRLVRRRMHDLLRAEP
jgi:phosphinothricin acetyltransferase